MALKTFIILVLLLPQIALSQDKVNYFKDSISYVHAYGIVEKNTVELMALLAQDTNNLVLVEGYNYVELTHLIDGSIDFWTGEAPLCSSQIKELLNLNNNIIGFDNYSRNAGEFSYFPKMYYEKLKPTLINNLMDSLDQQFTINADMRLNDFDLAQKQQILSVCVRLLELNKLDSFLLSESILGKKPDFINDLLKLNYGKKIIVFVATDIFKTGSKPYIDACCDTLDNRYMFVAHNYQSHSSKFKNRIKAHSKKQQFQLLANSDLPKNISFTKKDKHRLSELGGIQFIYVELLENCLYR